MHVDYPLLLLNRFVHVLVFEQPILLLLKFGLEFYIDGNVLREHHVVLGSAVDLLDFCIDGNALRLLYGVLGSALDLLDFCMHGNALREHHAFFAQL